MLDGDDPHEPLTRVPRPDHLDFLRITPPEDDIIGDTPYCPKLECTVSSTNTSIAVMHIFSPKHSFLSPSWDSGGFLSTQAFNHLIMNSLKWINRS